MTLGTSLPSQPPSARVKIYFQSHEKNACFNLSAKIVVFSVYN